MYKYDKENARIIDTTSNGHYAVTKSHKELEVLREALGLKKLGEQKYTIQFIKNSYDSFLNISRIDKRIFLDDNIETDETQTHFTQTGIDKLKQHDNLAIDWNKAIVKPAED